MKASTGAPVIRRTGYRRYLLGMLLVIFALHHVDRLALGLLLQEIGADLSLSDTQLGVLSGIAFALVFSVMGIPIAQWADRHNRVTIVGATTLLWSVAAMAYGMAATFVQLIVVRAAVAVGKAGVVPPAHSLIAEYFTRQERPRAMAIYMMGGSVSVVIGYFLAGWLDQIYGWRITFLLLGLPGFCVAIFAWLTLHEPRTHIPTVPGPQPRASSAAAPGVLTVCATLWGNKTFRQLLLCYSISFFASHGIAQWQPAFFIRSYGLETGELGTWFALVMGAGGLIGTYLGGEWACRYAANNEQLQLKAMAIAYLGFGIASVCIYVARSYLMAFALMGLAVAGISTTAGPLLATLQTLVPGQIRATSMALVYLLANLLGMGLGPFATGVLSDVLSSWAGNESLRYALLALSPAYLCCAWHLWRGSQTVERDVQAIERCSAKLSRGR